MNILAIDSSGQTASVAIVSDYITIGEITIHAKAKHSEILLPMIDRLFEFTNLTLNDINAVACVNGPGSFTGLRIGAATAMGLVKGSDSCKDLIAVPTLDALAYNISTGGYCMPMLDARREQVYTALYHCENGYPVRVTEYMALPVPEALTLANDKDVIFLGDGVTAYESIIYETFPTAFFSPANMNRQRAASAGVCAMHMLQKGYEPVPSIDLMYIRKPQAVREREERNH